MKKLIGKILNIDFDEDVSKYDAVTVELIGLGKLSPQPKPMGAMGWGLLLPSIAQYIGLTAMGWVAWSLTEASSIQNHHRVNLVLFGALALTLGSNVGSLPVAIQCFVDGLSSWRDWLTLIVSTGASFVETLIALQFLAGFEIAQNKPRILFMAALAILDTTFGMSALATHINSYKTRITKWHKTREKAVDWYYEREDKAQQLQPQQTYQVPTGDAAYTPPLPQPELGQPETNGNGGYCWCGKWCENSHVYPAHIRHDHIAETLYDPVNGDRYGSSATARDAMLERYKDTIPSADLPFPSLEKVNEMRRSKTAQKIQERMRRKAE